MSIDLYSDELQNVWLFGQPVLYTAQPIPREAVPAGWHCYGLRGTAENPSRPYELVNQAVEHFAGNILSDVPLKRSRSLSKLVPGLFLENAIPITLADHCAEEGIPYPRPAYTPEPEPAAVE